MAAIMPAGYLLKAETLVDSIAGRPSTNIHQSMRGPNFRRVHFKAGWKSESKSILGHQQLYHPPALALHMQVSIYLSIYPTVYVLCRLQ
jgi:hypothetical protein